MMKGKVLLGILVLVVGLIAAIYGVARTSEPDQGRDEAAIVGDQNEPDREEAASMLIPVVAGISIAAGAALIGIGIGAFRRPKIVPPDSPEASKAATTRGTTP
jgi:cadmium resistance protein CadD (predicted permease)